jgi:signal transduction histidine kinase
VDDEPANIQVLYELLAARHEVFCATEGTTALTMAEQMRPDLILLDVIMPEMEGDEVCRRLKSNAATRDIPVIFLTSCADPDRVVNGFSLGAMDYVTKPFRPPELLARVNTHIHLRLARQEIARQNAELKEQQKLFLEMIPHDLRTTLGVIQGYAEMLLRRPRKKECDPCPQHLEEILEGCRRQKTLINDLFDVGRLKAGQFALNKTPVPIDTLIAAALEIEATTPETAQLMVTLPEDLPEVRVDARSIQRVLTNLLTTARTYASGSTVVTIRAWQQAHEVVVAVCDEGEEIAPEDVTRIFVPYYWARRKGTTEGAGLSLYLVRLLVEAHGGRVWVEREEGRENRFCFSLPLDKGVPLNT